MTYAGTIDELRAVARGEPNEAAQSDAALSEAVLSEAALSEAALSEAGERLAESGSRIGELTARMELASALAVEGVAVVAVPRDADSLYASLAVVFRARLTRVVR